MNPRRASQVAAGRSVRRKIRASVLAVRRTEWRDESGQILPLLMVAMVAILVTGMIVFWLGYSTSLSANAQTAADAAALEGEKVIDTELQTPLTGVGGEYVPGTIDPTAVCAAANQYAEANHAHDTSCTPVHNDNSTLGYDVEVTAQTNAALPHGSPDAGHAATAQARASANPFAQASPRVKTVAAPCDASTVSGPTFVAHAGRFGFFASATTNYSSGCESKLAGALDALAVARHVRLTGSSGYSSAPSGSSGSSKSGNSSVIQLVASAHACGAASTTQGLAKIPNSVLLRYGLTRPFPGKPDEVELSGVDCGQQTTNVDSPAATPVSLGNMNIHLVPFDSGGPAGSLVSLVGGGASSIGENALQVGCQIYKVAQALKLPQKALLIGLIVAETESAMGQNVGTNRTDPNESVGVYQQISSDGWGTIPEELNVTTSAEMFFLGGHNATGQATTQGLMYYYSQDSGLPTYELAQDTQGSGAGASSDGLANYGAQANVDAAQSMLTQVTSGACGKASKAS